MKLQFNLSSRRIQKAVQEGIVLKSQMTIDVDLTALSTSDREVLSRNIVYDHKYNIFLVNVLSGEYSDSRSTQNQVASEKIEGIIESMRNLELQREQYKVKEKARVIADINEFITGKTMRVLGTGIYSDYSGSFDFKELRAKYDSLDIQSPSFNEIESKAMQYEEAKKEKKRQIEADAAEKAASVAAKKADIEAKRSQLLAWAKENGSELLKLRIKHDQNWQTLAVQEWALAHSNGFALWCDKDEDSEWTVRNASLDQLKELEKAQQENPEHSISIVRCKFVSSDSEGQYDDEIWHKTFLVCAVQTPIETINLYREIMDSSEE